MRPLLGAQSQSGAASSSNVGDRALASGTSDNLAIVVVDAGGYDTANVKIHMVNDYHDTIPGHACDAGLGGYLLYEGSYFKDVTTPFTTNTDGYVYAPLDSTLSSTSSACSSALGRACVANYANSGTSSFRLDAAGLTAFSSLALSLVTPYPAAEVPNCVPHLAGPGHI